MDFVGIDKLSMLDYKDKIACVLFSKACNFACPFCHNGLTVLDSNDFVPFEDILSYLRKRKGMLDGVVISGGEPTLLNDLKEKIKAIKEIGYPIKLDTNGTNPNMIKELIDEGLIDYIAMDIKNSEDKYPSTAGKDKVDIEKIKESISIIKQNKIDYEFRTTLVKEFHFLEDVPKIGELIKDSKVLYLQKFVEREGCIKKGLHEVSEDQALIFKKELEKYIKEVNLRGYRDTL